MKISTRNVGRHITRFENAVREHAFRGTIIPAASDGDEDAQAALEKVDRDYELAKANLTRFIIEAIIEGGGR
jgi:hypothetical protein